MCQRTGPPGKLFDFFEILGIEADMEALEVDSMQGNPTDPHVVVVEGGESGTREAELMRWGLVPSWAQGTKGATNLLHARAETLLERPSFLEAFLKRRCIIPMSSFYEFSADSRYLISMKDGSMMGVAGLWESKRVPGQKPLNTFTIITTPSNQLISAIHPRMPAILRPEDYGMWMDYGSENLEVLTELLHPYNSREMSMVLDGPRKSVKSKSAGQLQSALFE